MLPGPGEQAETSDNLDGGAEQPTNPASRLHDFLTRAVKKKTESLSRDEWLTKQGIDPTDQSAIREFALQVIATTNEVRTSIDLLPPSGIQSLLGRHLTQVDEYITRVAFAVNRRIPHEQVSTEVLFSLELCSALFSEHGIVDEKLESGTTDRLLKLIHTLIEEVKGDTSIPAAGRLYLLERLQEVERALLRIDLLGVTFVQSTVDRLIGGAIAYPEIRKKSFLERLANLWHGVHSNAGGVQEISAAASSVIDLAHSITGPTR